MPQTFVANAVSGNDSGTGDVNDPFLTLNKLVESLSPGDTGLMRGAGAFGQLNANSITVPSGTSYADAPVIKSYPDETATIRAFAGEGINLNRDTIQYLIFEDFNLDATNNIAGISVFGGANHIRFRNVVVFNCQVSGIYVSPGSMPAPYSTFVEFIGCTSHSNGTSGSESHGFYISTSDNLLDSCEVYNNPAFGAIFFSSDGKVLQNNVMDGMLSHDNGQIATTSAGLLMSNSGGGGGVIRNCISYNDPMGIDVANRAQLGTQVLNNTIYSPTFNGIQVLSDPNHPPETADGTIVQDNIILNPGQYGLNIGVDAINTVHGNNHYFGGGSGTFRDLGTSTTNNGSNFTTDPLLTDPANLDFTPQSGSLAINSAITSVAVAFDFFGNIRPQGANSDRGAVEVLVAENSPIVTVPVAQSMDQDTTLIIPGVSVTDVDGDLDTVQVTVTNGTITASLSGDVVVTAGARGTTTFTISGIESQINNTLNTLIFTPTTSYVGAALFTLTATDDLANEDTNGVNITVNSTSITPPVNTVPGTLVEIIKNTQTAVAVSATDAENNISTIQCTTAQMGSQLNVTLSGAATAS